MCNIIKHLSFQYRSDRELRKLLARKSKNVPTKKIAFDSFTDIKSEIGPLAIKSEPKWEMEIDTSKVSVQENIETVDTKDIIIANTIIRKVDPVPEIKPDNNFDADVSFVQLLLYGECMRCQPVNIIIQAMRISSL